MNPRNSDIHPCLTYNNAKEAIEWLCSAFGFIKRFVVLSEEGAVQHSELSLGSGVIMVASPKSDGSRSPLTVGACTQSLSVFVEDPDAHYLHAVSAGARVVRELRTEEYGARGYQVADVENHIWYFGNYRPGAYWAEERAVDSAA